MIITRNLGAGNSQTIKVRLGSAITTNELYCQSNWLDISSSAEELPGCTSVDTNGTSLVILVDQGGSLGTLRRIKYLNVYNRDTVPAQVEILFADSSIPATRTLVKITLQVGDTLFYEDGAGWSVITKNGIIRSGCCDSITSESMVNLLINGGFDYAQRQAPGTLTTYSSTTGRAYGADRWGMTNENASIQYQRIDTNAAPETGLQARYYGKFKKITASGKICVSQVIEGRDSLPVRGRIVRLQAKMKFSVAGSMTVRLALAQLTSAGTIDTIPATFISAFNADGTDPTFGTNISLITPLTADGGSIVGSAVSCVLTSNWARYSGTFLAPTNHKNLIALVFSNADLNGLAQDELNISEFDLHDGSDIREWIPSLLADELERCQRFYVKTFNIDTNPVQNNGANTGEIQSIAGKAAAAAEMLHWRFPVAMRSATATRTSYNPAAANAQVRDLTAAADCTVVAFANTSETGTSITATGNAGTAVGNTLGIHATIDAEL